MPPKTSKSAKSTKTAKTGKTPKVGKKPKVVESSPDQTQAPAPVEPTPTPAPEQTPLTVVEQTPGGTRTRRVVTPESMDSDFGAHIATLNNAIESHKGNKNAREEVKTLRVLLKQAKALQADTRKIVKKKRVNKQGAVNSGFKKPAAISDELANFLGLEPGCEISRTDCTKGLQAYIIENKLQNPKDRREIMADRSLAKLLNYNPKEHGVLHYYDMQRMIQRHFVKSEA